MLNLSSKIERFLAFFETESLRQNKELIFLVTVLVFPFLSRMLPFTSITIIFIAFLFLFLLNHFYKYTNKIALSETLKHNTNQNNTLTSKIEYSWGFVKQELTGLDTKNFITFIKTKDFKFFKEYVYVNKEYFIILAFVFGDMLIAFKNLSLSESGVYFLLSVFTKFVFLAYLYINKSYSNILNEKISFEDKETKILDTFYKHFNGLVSVSIVLFILFFILSKFLVEIFFGFEYAHFQTSLPFILLANLAALICLVMFRTSTIIDASRTWNLLRIFTPIFTILFVFMSINYYDTVAYFVMGANLFLAIFLYNFCIRKPAYIESTYNSLF